MMNQKFDRVSAINPVIRPNFTIKVRIVRLWHRASYNYDKSADAGEGMIEFVLCDNEVICDLLICILCNAFS